MLWGNLMAKKSLKKDETSHSDTKAEAIKRELKGFIKMESIDLESDPLIWWCSQGRHLFPNLFLIAEKLLICQATR